MKENIESLKKIYQDSSADARKSFAELESLIDVVVSSRLPVQQRFRSRFNTEDWEQSLAGFRDGKNQSRSNSLTSLCGENNRLVRLRNPLLPYLENDAQVLLVERKKFEGKYLLFFLVVVFTHHIFCQ